MCSGNEYINSALIEFKNSLTPDVENHWRDTCSHVFMWLDLVRWENFTTHLLLRVRIFSIPRQFQIKPSLPSSWIHRSADLTFQCYLASSSMIMWHILMYSLPQVTVYENALFLTQWVQMLGVPIPFPVLKSLYFWNNFFSPQLQLTYNI